MTEMCYGGPLLICIDINKHKQNLVTEHTNGNTKNTQTEDKASPVINVKCFKQWKCCEHTKCCEQKRIN